MESNIFTDGHALIIGVGADLKCTIDDAKGLANILKDTQRCAYPSEQIQLLTATQATRSGILTALDNLAQTVKQDSTLLIYFSGHGYQQENNYYLIPNGFSPLNFHQTTITGEEFASKISVIPATRKIILLDCCHAGGVGDVKDLSLTKSPLPQEALDLFKQGSGYVLIASSKEDEKSYTGKPYSVFTATLIEALCGKGVAKKDGYVRVADLIGHAREYVPQLTDNKQHPVIHFEKADNFVISYYAGGEEKPKELPFTMKTNKNNELEKQIADIEKFFTRARYIKAFQQYTHLCNDYPDYQLQANMILSRFSDYENHEIMAIQSSQQLNIMKQEISISFLKSLMHFKQEYLPKGQ